MYDKQGSVLRIETTINDARDLRVHRASETDPTGPKTLRVLRKGVVDLPRRAQISQAANERYLTALACVETSLPLSTVLDRLAKPRQGTGGRVRGLHPLTGDDARMVTLLLRGEFTLNGFRNRDLRTLLFPTTDNPENPENPDNPTERRRQSAQVGRWLRLFKEHGLIHKIPGTHRYQLSRQGLLLPAIINARQANTQKLQQLVT